MDLIMEELGDRLGEAGGYLTRPALDKDGSVIGQELVSAAAGSGIEGYESYRFLSYTGADLEKDNEVWRIEAARLLQEASYYPFSFAGFLGGYELVIPQYRAALAAFLASPLPCVGAIQTLEHTLMQAGVLGLGDRFTALARQFHDALRSDTDTLVLELSNDDVSRVRTLLSQWIAQWLD